MRKTYRRSEEDKKKISERSKKRWSDPEFRKIMIEKIKINHVSWNKGMKMLEKYPNWGMVGKKHSKEWWEKNGSKFTRKGKKASIETIKKLRDSHFSGGNSPLIKRIRGLWENDNWKKLVKERDSLKCIRCFCETDLQVDHIVSFKTIYDKFLLNYAQFSEIEDKETLVRLAMQWDEFWDIKNGRTLCARCHRDR